MPKTAEKIIPVRFNFPEDVHSKVMQYQRQKALVDGKRVTFEEAIITIVREFHFERLVPQK